MQKWDYDQWSDDALMPKETLCEWGGYGWELVSVTGVHEPERGNTKWRLGGDGMGDPVHYSAKTTYTHIFKRPLD